MDTITTIPLSEALARLTLCAAVIVEGGYVTFPNVVEEGDEDTTDECLRIGRDEWDDDPVRFTNAANQQVGVNALTGELILRDSQGHERRLLLLRRSWRSSSSSPCSD